jgi:hypothetical protein
VAVGFNVGGWPAGERAPSLTDPQVRLTAVTLLIVKAAVVVGIGLLTVRLPARRASSIALWLVVAFYVAVVGHNVAQIASV